MQVTHDSRSAISRANFFLGLAEAAPPESRVEFEAYLEAAIVFARAAVHRFQSKHKKHPQWKSWWNALLKDASVNFFRAERDWILKEGAPKIGQKVFGAFIGPGEESSEGYVPARATEFYYFEDPDIPATETVRRHLDALAKLLADAEPRLA